jgi:hypothetical protein
MATEIQSWQIVGGKLVSVKANMIEEKKREKNDLEQWIKTNSEILGKDIVLIGEQVNTKSGPVDFLGIDSNGNPVVIELKRDKLPRESLAQAIDYASDISTWEIEKYREICLKYTSKTLEDYLSENIEGEEIEELIISQSIRILLVGFSIEEPLSRMIEWLSGTYSISINAIILNYIKTNSGDELLSKTVIIPEEIDQEKANKKFVIQMSNEPGQYSDDELENKLKDYFNKGLYSAQRIKEHLLPILLENRVITRVQLKKELVKRSAAPDESQAGYFVSLISNQLGHKWKDYLRQIIKYEFPNHKWEKDNFSLNEKYRNMVIKITGYNKSSRRLPII